MDDELKDALSRIEGRLDRIEAAQVATEDPARWRPGATMSRGYEQSAAERQQAAEGGESQ